MNRLLPGLSRQNMARELLAGVTLIAIAIPLNIGYAQIAGLPPTAGLYALVVPTLVWALLTSSRQLVASPDASAAALVASSVGGLAAAGSEGYAAMAMAQAIICGVLFLAMAVLKLGFLASFLSRPILIGFVAGLALDVFVSQLAKMLGVHVDSGGELTEKLVELITELATANSWSILISLIAVAVLLVGRHLVPSVPWALVVLVAATVVVVLTHAEVAGVKVLGDVPAGPPELTWPTLAWNQWLALVPSAVALTVVATTEGLLVSRSYGEKHRYPTRADRDLVAFGAANLAAGTSGSFAVGASTSRTAAMDQAGSRTQVPSLVLAGGTILLLLFGTALLAEIPAPAIGVIVGIAVLPLFSIGEFRRLWSLSRFEFSIALACLAATVFVGAIAGILVAFVLSLVNLARRAAQPAIDVLAENDDPAASLLDDAPIGAVTAPGVIVVRMAAPLFFANGAVFAQAVKHAVEGAGSESVQHLVIDMEAVTDIDVTAATAFDGLRTWLQDRQISLAFSRARTGALPRLRRFGIVLSHDPIYTTNRAAVADLSARSPEIPTTGDDA
ncbi:MULTISPECIES: SulP family inorganic anion transporter [unclassified Gordonia (in: high G+C Gram-positive bacteria)]|uniref:SulP family inorganic anion transporter n=1 Tax=unclassified Gordonia (in: high G+C Gram-positive bacteria) TaxID=2657482 RepID=UPI001F06A0F7|nr:SulP family inorganic anion transporter [Gordonia sp. PDNC005]